MIKRLLNLIQPIIHFSYQLHLRLELTPTAPFSVQFNLIKFVLFYFIQFNSIQFNSTFSLFKFKWFFTQWYDPDLIWLVAWYQHSYWESLAITKYCGSYVLDLVANNTSRILIAVWLSFHNVNKCWFKEIFLSDTNIVVAACSGTCILTCRSGSSSLYYTWVITVHCWNMNYTSYTH